jgi:hypothetical protein
MWVSRSKFDQASRPPPAGGSLAAGSATPRPPGPPVPVAVATAPLVMPNNQESLGSTLKPPAGALFWMGARVGWDEAKNALQAL